MAPLISFGSLTLVEVLLVFAAVLLLFALPSGVTLRTRGDVWQEVRRRGFLWRPAAAGIAAAVLTSSWRLPALTAAVAVEMAGAAAVILVLVVALRRSLPVRRTGDLLAAVVFALMWGVTLDVVALVSLPM